MYSFGQVHLLHLGEKFIFFSSFTPPLYLKKASHSYTKTARDLIGGIHVKRRALPLVNSVTRQFSDVSQFVFVNDLDGLSNTKGSNFVGKMIWHFMGQVLCKV